MMKIEWFPKENQIRLQDAFLLLVILGTFGVHQLYIGNKKKALYFFFTSGLSHILLIFSLIYDFSLLKVFDTKIVFIGIFAGYILGVPVWIYDFITLVPQVRKRNGDVNLL